MIQLDHHVERLLGSDSRGLILHDCVQEALQHTIQAVALLVLVGVSDVGHDVLVQQRAQRLVLASKELEEER